jgi:pilus assembly protein Flp/PilA
MLKKILSVKSQKGATMIEYALIAALISIAAVTFLPQIGTEVSDTFEAVLGAFTPAEEG